MRRLFALLLVWFCSATAAFAQPQMITDLSQSRIDISYRFAGAELLVYGAIHYAGGEPPSQPPDFAVILRGPAEAITVRHKARVAGIWVNTESERFETALGYYAIAVTRPVQRLLDERNAAIYEIGLDHLQLSPATTSDPAQTRMFEQGLINLRKRNGLYVEQPYGVKVTDGILYRARLPIPSAVPVGNYRVETYMIVDGEIVAQSAMPVIIDKLGMERGIYVYAHEHSFLYGLMAVGVALLLGLAGNMLFRKR